MRRALGTSGITVHAIGLGGMPMSLAGHPPEAQSIETIHAALDAGVDFIDTADVYCVDHRDIGANERLIARALAAWTGPRDRVVVATKGGLLRPNGDWTSDASPAHLAAACDASLRALNVRTIDLYQLHAPDDAVPLEDSVGALARLRESGKIRHVGLSNVSVDEIRRASAIVPIATVQNRCNILEPEGFEDGVVAHCEANGIAYLPYAPLGGFRHTRSIRTNPAIMSVAAKHHASPYRVALAWLLAKSPSIVPIPGASRPETARDSARAADVVLSTEDIALLDTAAQS